MLVPLESVDLQETHAEISIRDRVARKRFTLVYGSRSSRTIWLELTLEPGQRLVAASYGILRTEDPQIVFLEFPLDPQRRRAELVFETVEELIPEDGVFRVETFNAFDLALPLALVRRTASVRIESGVPIGRIHSPTHPVEVQYLDPHTATLRMDLSGNVSRGKFRFFFGPGPTDPRKRGLLASLPSSRGTEPSPVERDFLEPRRFRPRRRAGLRRLP